MSAIAHHLAGPPSRDDVFTPRFRVLTVGGDRRAFRLEGIFWTVLALIAQRNGRSLTSEVSIRLGDASEGQNASAFLRASIASDLLSLWQTAHAAGAKPAWSEVLEAMPEPAFASVGVGRLAVLNGPMRRLLERRGLPRSVGGHAPAIHVDFAEGAMFHLNNAGHHQHVCCNALFRAGRARAFCRVRLVLADRAHAEAPLILGFPAPA